MTTQASQAVSKRPALALLALVGALCFPALNLTIEEWKDAVDDKPTTVLQWELIIDAWFSSLTQLAIAVYAYANRNELVKPKET